MSTYHIGERVYVPHLDAFGTITTTDLGGHRTRYVVAFEEAPDAWQQPLEASALYAAAPDVVVRFPAPVPVQHMAQPGPGSAA